ncbi:MAG: Response Regulator [Treponematales bacterium]
MEQLVRQPMWLKFAGGIVVLLLLVLVVDTLIISFLISGDVRVTAESNNYYINQQRAQRVEEAVQSIRDDSRLQLGVLSASASQALRDLSMENFFRIHRDIAAIVVSGGSSTGETPEIRMMNEPFFAVNKIAPQIVDSALASIKDDINLAAYGESVLRNVTEIFDFPMIAMLFPTDSGKTQGVAIFLSSDRYIADFGTGTNQSFMINGKGDMLVHSDIETLRSGFSNESSAIQTTILPSTLNDMQTMIWDNNGIQYFCAFRKLPKLDAIVVTQIPYDTVFEGVQATVRRNIYLAVIILSLSVGFAWFFSHSITHPVQNLMQAVRKVEAGDYQVDIPVKSKDELGVLGASFNSMSQSLEKTHKELNDAYSQLKKVNEGLENTVKERTAELEKQTKLAKSASKAKSDFLATMSHEIRTPMNAIMGMVEIMDTNNLTEKQISYFRDIRLMSKALLNIINDILDISKIEAGKLELVPVHYDLYALFDNVGTISSFSAAAKSLALITQKSKSLPRYLYGDEIRVRQIFTNVISNAIKYTPEGNVAATLKTGISRSGKQFIVFVVKDTGIGIKKEDLPKLFGNFQRLDTQKTRTIQGTGLGLAITKQLVDMMGGTVKVESEYGKGSTFTITFPLVPGDARQIKNTEDSSRVVRAMPGADLRILVTDDIPINLNVAQGFLEKHGMKADTACDGVDALNKVKAKEKTGAGYDLVFLDLLMPNMDGITAVQKIRELGGRFKNLPIVALTANAMTESIDECFKAGMSDFLSKPITDAELNAILGKWLPPEKIIIGGKMEKVPQTVKKTLAVEPIPPQVVPRPEKKGGSLTAYRRDINKRINAINDCLQHKDWKQYALQFGALKNIASRLGQRNLEKYAKKLELAGKAAANGNSDGAAELNRIQAENFCVEKTRTLLNAFAAFQNKPERSNAAAVKPAASSARTKQTVQATAPRVRTASNNPLGRIAEIPGLDIETGLQFTGGDTEFYKVTLRQFCSDFDGLRDAVFDDVAKRDWKDYGIKLHGFKGMLAMIGAVKLSEWAKKLEFAGKAADTKGSASDAKVCAAEARPIMKAIEELRDNIINADKAGESPARQRKAV